MNSKLLPVSSALALSLAACRHSASHTDASAHDRSSPPTHGVTLKSNQGRKWVLPPPMMAHLRNIETGVLELEAAPTRNHPALAAAIRKQLGDLVTQCTMEGKAHDELHKWLMPFLSLAEDYFKAADARVQEEKYREVQRSLAVFNRYFE